MKIILIVLGITLIPFLMNGQCNPNGITTNPDSPLNNQLQGMTNTFFDWRDNAFDINSTKFPPLQTNILSPFNPNAQNSIIYSLSQSEDNKPEDGWELISWDFGFDLNGAPSSPPVGVIHFMLYNKYTSILRVFAAGEGLQGYNSAIFTIETESTAPISSDRAQPSLIQHPSLFTGLDKHYEGEIKSASEFFMITNNWIYADFFMNYDPCVCLYESIFNYKVKFVNTANVILTGALNGQIVSASGGTSSVTKNGLSYNLETIVTGYSKFKSFYDKGKNIGELTDDIDEILSTTVNMPTTPQFNVNGQFYNLAPAYLLEETIENFHNSSNPAFDMVGLGLQMIPYVGVKHIN